MPLKKFATQVDAKLLGNIRKLADKEGRQLQALVNEALSDLLEKRSKTKPRLHVMTAYSSSHEKFEELYKKLAQ